jgi:general secretion pathway protein L
LRMPRAADAAAGWLVTDPEGRPHSAAQTGPLADAAGAVAGRRVAVLVSAADVLTLEVELPARAGQRAAALAPFALEEQLAADIESQHFAVGRVGEAGRTPVAVVSRALLEQWLAQLTAAGIQPELMCADATLLPRVPGHSVALLEGDTLAVLRGDTQDMPVSIAAPPGGFAGAMAVACGGDMAGTQLLLHATPLEWQRRSAEVEAARAQLASLKVQLLNSGALPWLAAQLQSAAPVNLLQGPYGQRKSLAAGWGRWRVAAALAGALVVLHLASQGFALWRLNRTAQELDSGIAAIAGPEWSGGTGSVRQRLEQRLLLAQSQSGQSGLLPALQVLAQALGGVPGARLEALNFHDGALQLKVRAADAQSLDRINRALRAAGWQADLVSGAAAGDAYEGNIQLRGGAS